MKKKIIVVGSGNAALCAGIAALEKSAEVLMLEKADEKEAGGNSKYTAGAMRFVYNSNEDLYPLLPTLEDSRIKNTEFGTYSLQKFRDDFLAFNDGKPLNCHQNTLMEKSYETIKWLAGHNVTFQPIYSRQSFKKNGKYIFWGGLTLEAGGEGVGLVEVELNEFLKLGGKIQYNTEVYKLLCEGDNTVKGIQCKVSGKDASYFADAVILASGGFEASEELRKKIMGKRWGKAKVRGTKHNTGNGIKMALEAGAIFHGLPDGCHAVPMDLYTPDYGNPDIPHIERKHYRKICYFLGIMLNSDGYRFVDEGINFRNYTYAQFGKAILEQPGSLAWQVYDNKVDSLLYEEYRFRDAHFVEANTLEELMEKMEGIDPDRALKTIHSFNNAVDETVTFDPTVLDKKSTLGLPLNKSNWANKIDTPPFKAYPVTCGITFTYGGLKTDENAAVVDASNKRIPGLFACGELVGGIFYKGYPGGSGLTSGAVFGRLAGYAAVE